MNAHLKVLPAIPGRVWGALLVLLAALVTATGVASGAELIPSVGLTKPVDGDANARMFGGLAVRGELLPFLKDEIGVSYRSEERLGGLVKTRMWPVTASLWLTPVPLVYAGAGVGWYNVTYGYNQALLGNAVQDETKQQFGVHVGGGLCVPMSSAVAVDLHGRYVMMRDQQSRLVPERFNPDFWTATLGLALHF